ncbi:MAG: putative tRNA/rRNA methyltransferase YfiF [Pseudomonadota bacterium]
MKTTEQKLYGWNACISFSKVFPNKIIRAYCTESTRGRLGALLKQLASKKKAYHIVTDDELSKIADSEHHEGVCLLVERADTYSESQLILDSQKLKQNKQIILCLDAVSNPNNLGAIARSAVHFGITHLFLCNTVESSLKGLLSGAFHRTAEGAAVHLNIYWSENGEATLLKLKQQFGWKIFSTTSHGRAIPLHQFAFPNKTVLIMGSESRGVSDSFTKIADAGIEIAGSGLVESLNVANAVSIFLSEYHRQILTQRTLEPVRRLSPTRVAGGVGKNRKGS